MENGRSHWDGNETTNSMTRTEFLSKLRYLKFLNKKSAQCSKLVRVPLIKMCKNGTNKLNVANRRKFSSCMICGGQRGFMQISLKSIRFSALSIILPGSYINTFSSTMDVLWWYICRLVTEKLMLSRLNRYWGILSSGSNGCCNWDDKMYSRWEETTEFIVLTP